MTAAAGTYAAEWAVAAFVLVYALAPAQRYTEAFSSGLVFVGGQKTADLVVLPIVVVVGLLAFAAAAGGLQRAGEQRLEIATQVLWWSVPFVGCLAGMVLGATVGPWAIALSVAASTTTLALGSTSGRRGRPVPATSVAMSVLGAVLWGVVPLAAALVLGRVPRAAGGWADGVPWPTVALLVGASALVGQVVLARLHPTAHARSVRWFVLLPQVGLPLFWLVLLPARLRLPDGRTTSYPVSPALALVVVALVALGIGAVARRWWASRSTSDAAARWVVPSAVLALVVAVVAGRTEPAVIDDDDYHRGELLLGGVVYSRGGLPYVDHVPAHGILQDDLGSVLAHVLSDGSATVAYDMQRLVYALTTALVLIGMLRVTRSLPLATVSALLLGSLPSWAFLVAISCLWLWPALRRRPAAWLCTWLVSVPVVLLAVPAQGLLLVAASVFLVAGPLVELAGRRSLRGWVWPIVAVAALTLLVGWTPLRSMLGGAIGYVLDNAGINQVAYGREWDPPIVGDPATTTALDLVRTLWVVGPAVGLVVAWHAARRRRWEAPQLAAGLFFAAFLALATPYVMGRIDPESPSRGGIVGSMVFAGVVPLLLWPLLGRARRAVLAVVMVMAVCAVRGPLTDPADLALATAANVDNPPLYDGGADGLPGWGTAGGDPAHYAQLRSLAAALDQDLPPGAPYLDLTSYNAQHVYLGRPPVVPIPALYNLPARADQQRWIDDVAADPPRLALLRGLQDPFLSDGGGVALRTPYANRYVQRTYRPFVRDGIILGALRSERPAAVGESVEVEVVDGADGVRTTDPVEAAILTPGSRIALADGSTRRVLSRSLATGVVTLDRRLGVPGATVRVTLDDDGARLHESLLFDRALGRADLKRLPSTWGQSDVVDSLRPVTGGLGGGTVPEGGLDVDVSSEGLSGADADVLGLSVSCRSGSSTTIGLSVSWSGGALTEPFEAVSRTFTAVPGRQLVPMDSSAFWTRAPSIDDLHVEVTDPGTCDGVRVDGLRLLERR